MTYLKEVKNSKELKKKLKDSPVSFVMFYADWCGFCKQIKPEWNKFVNINKLKDLQMICIESEHIDPSFGIQGYPTLKVYENGKFKDYKGGRTSNEMAEYFEICNDCGKRKRLKRLVECLI